MKSKRKIERFALGTLLVAYVILAVGFSLANPIYESPDELRHVRYVRHIATYRSLPVQRAGEPRAQSHHPPLYYFLGALVSCWVDVEQDVYYQPVENPFWAYRYWEVSDDNKNQYVPQPYTIVKFLPISPLRGIFLVIYLVRWMTVLIGAGVVWLTYRIGVRVFRDRRALALGGAALVAFHPQFLYLSGAVCNDVPAALLGAAVLLVCIRIVQEGARLRTDVTLGLLFGLAMLTKIHLVVLLAPIELAYALTLWQKRDWRAFVRANVLVIGLAGLTSGWWFARNQILYGDPLGVSVHSQLWNSRSPSDGWWALRQELPYLWSSFWGRFGYGQVVLPTALYRGLFVFTVLALIGYLMPRHRSLSAGVFGIIVTSVLVFVAWVLFYTLVQPAGARGRFLFPCLSAFAILLVGGLYRLSPFSTGWPTVLVTAVMMVTVSVYALVGVLVPAFAPPQRLSASEIEAMPNAVSIDFRSTSDGEVRVARLLGYEVSATEVRPGDRVDVTLYWKALARTERNHVVFVHLISDSGVMIAQRDTYPGLGRFPTTAWDVGSVFADTYRVHIPDAAYAPDRGYVQVGLYVPDGPRLTTEGGTNAVPLTAITVRPGLGHVPNAMHVNFGDEVALIGYSLDQRSVQPGETVGLTLYWRALSDMAVNYDVFVHVLGAENQIWANSNSPLTDHAVCTNRWEPGVVVEEHRDLTVAEATPVGFYDLEIGLYYEGGRLQVLAEDGRPLGNRKLLSKIRVVNSDE